MSNDRIAYLLGKLHSGAQISAAEHDECLRLGIKPDGERAPHRMSAADVATKSGCSERTFRSIFG